MNLITKVYLVLVTGLVTLASIGCGNDANSPYKLREVTGTVKLEGNPLPNATVVFRLQRDDVNPKGGRAAIGTTDTEGKFRLSYIREVMGAPVGTHLVSITTGQAFEGGENGSKPAIKELVPAKYNKNNANNDEMKINVPEGSDELVIDFDLKE